MSKNFSLGQIGDAEIKQLKIFKTVVDCGGFSAAETQLNISRPTISIHIANLESRLHLTLCKRGRSGFALTEEGAVIYEQTERLLGMLDGFRNTVNNLSSVPSGQLKVALSDTFSTDPRCLFPDILQRFTQQAPDVELHIGVEQMADMERQVLNDEVDIAFIPYHRKLEGLHYIHLFSDDCYLYCGKLNPLYHLNDALITDDKIHQARLVHAGLKPHEEVYQQLSVLNLAAVSYHYESRIAMLLSGHFIAFLPEKVAQPYVDTQELRALAPATKHFTLGAAAICKRSYQPNRAKDMFWETIRHCFENRSCKAPY